MLQSLHQSENLMVPKLQNSIEIIEIFKELLKIKGKISQKKCTPKAMISR